MFVPIVAVLGKRIASREVVRSATGAVAGVESGTARPAKALASPADLWDESNAAVVREWALL